MHPITLCAAREKNGAADGTDKVDTSCVMCSILWRRETNLLRQTQQLRRGQCLLARFKERSIVYRRLNIATIEEN